MSDAPFHNAAVIPDEFVPDPQVQKEFNITLMTLWRWTRDPELSFPPPIRVRNRNFRSRRALEEFKARMVRVALEDRVKPSAHPTPPRSPKPASSRPPKSSRPLKR
jgi:hypothetical protein